MRIVDTKGQACPAPLIALKKAMRESQKGESFILITDNKTSFDNLNRFLNENNTKFSINNTGSNLWELTIANDKLTTEDLKPEEYCTSAISHFQKGNFIVVISSDKMGDGDEELGHLLMCNFIKALKDLDKLPDKIIFYNKGVTLVTNSSGVISHLRDLEKMGVELLLCATCVNHYSLQDSVGAGILSNIFSITEIMASSGNILKP
jgi:selenium metabolism protein YedF